MIKYYNNNLVYAYRIYLIVCTGIVALAGMATLYIVVKNYKKYESHMTKTYVYSTNGASIEVNAKQKEKWNK